MSMCGGMRSRFVRTPGSHKERPGPEADDARAVHGTWDYKWPQGSKIRVAFLEVPQSELKLYRQGSEERDWCSETTSLSDIKHTVAEVATKWTTGTNLTLEFDLEREYPANGTPSRGQREYHVLVSVAPLVLDESSRKQDEDVIFPSAELGRFACRADYGRPTVYVGKREGYTRSYVKDKISILGDVEYFKSKEFRHWVCHEFGHVLGLAHIHQDPRVPERVFKRDQELIAEIKRESRKEVTQAFVRRGILERWPCLVAADRRVLYSDWWDQVPENVDNSKYLDYFKTSVMTHSIIGRLLQGTGPGELLHLPDQPTAADRALVQRMYPC